MEEQSMVLSDGRTVVAKKKVWRKREETRLY
jgi:hypothetical protein